MERWEIHETDPDGDESVHAVILEEGRFTVQREDETPAEAMNRLTEGGPDCYPLPKGLDQPVSRFARGGRITP